MSTVDAPNAECDVVMKGGITSGVIYPGVLARLAEDYRFRGLGGASAGAIGAALGAAAEYGRASGGFVKLRALPKQLDNGGLLRLFQPTRKTRPMLRLMVGLTRPVAGPTWLVRLWRVVRAVPLVSLIGVLPGVLAVIYGAGLRWPSSLVVVLLGALAVVVGWLAAVGLRVWRLLTHRVVDNMFGICTGHSESNTAFTDWLSTNVDALAGTTSPLTFGQLWAGPGGSAGPAEAPVDGRPADPCIDLRMVATSLSEAHPFEMPWSNRRYFYDPDEWARLFPASVMAHLAAHPAPSAGDAEVAELAAAGAAGLTLNRLPLAQDLPVIVATRMSLSFPLLISAVPMWTIDRRRSTAGAPAFVKVWFTDGGLCSNFPLFLFDAALPTRPTFAVNLDRFADDGDESQDEQTGNNIRMATGNNTGLAPRISEMPAAGAKAVAGFAGAAFRTAQNWNDTVLMNQPGFRDRIVHVLQTATQGGMNLEMSSTTIERLVRRGEHAGAVAAQRFAPGGPGWENHRWVRYRAMLSVLPAWLGEFRDGHAALGLGVDYDTSYPVGPKAAEALATTITDSLLAAGQAVADATAGTRPTPVDHLRAAPRPAGTLARRPDL